MTQLMKISGLGGEQPHFERTVPAAISRPGGPSAASESPFSRALQRLGTEIDRGERQVLHAGQLRNYDTASLIALQVGIYRYTEAVELASKIVDRATNAARTVLQGSH